MFTTTHTRMQLRIAAVLGATALIGGGIAGPAYATGAGNERAASHQTSGTSGTSGDPSSPQPKSRADRNGTGANQSGPYDSTRDGSPSRNGNGDGKATGKPCAGCVGKADNKNPRGQYPGGSDHNAGYECDRNRGIGQGNPAHTGCTSTSPYTDPAVTPSEGSTDPSCNNGTKPTPTPAPKPGTTPTPAPEKDKDCAEEGAEEGATPVVAAPVAGSPAAGCPLPMSPTDTDGKCNVVAGPMVSTGSTLAATAVEAPASSSKAGAERGSASIIDRVADVLPQTGAAAAMLWAALAGLLLAAAGAGVLLRSRIRS